MIKGKPLRTKYTETFNVEVLENPHRGKSICFRVNIQQQRPS